MKKIQKNNDKDSREDAIMKGRGCFILFVFMPPLLLGWPLYVIFNEIRKKKNEEETLEDSSDEK